MTPNTALFSDDGVYRWMLTRELGGSVPLVVCGLNPSTATAEINDPTIRREIAFAKLWTLGRLVKVNAYGFRATDPKVIKAARKAGRDIVGIDNDHHITAALHLVVSTGGRFVVAWGRNIEPARELELAKIIASHGVTPMCFGTDKKTGAAYPEHPLYVPYSRELREWQIAA